MPPAIRVENLSKRYRIGRTSTRGGYRTLRESLSEGASSLIRRFRGLETGGPTEEFWALKGVDFEVQPGEVVGVIGRNGAGKSTLLKILSRITEPSEGRVRIRGRVGSLLEVGTGFHPELSGRENIFLNGAILGMTRREIAKNFDAIVAFSEIEKFIDTPVKRYSSGMYVRLAFAVAAHLEPEILIVDEVLAVGDLSFQKKCLGKMGEVSSHGRTIFFVSHNMQAISALTTRCLVLKGGEVALDGKTGDAVKAFVRMMNDGGDLGSSYENRSGPPDNRVASFRVLTSETGGVQVWARPLTYEVTLRIAQPLASLGFSFQVVDGQGRPVCHYWLVDPDLPFRSKAGEFTFAFEVPRSRLYMGSYTISTWLDDRRGQRLVEGLSNLCPFEVSMGDLVRPDYEWTDNACVFLEDSDWRLVETREIP
jgi:lipopolysaccharide transport system ATP-binding protein